MVSGLTADLLLEMHNPKKAFKYAIMSYRIAVKIKNIDRVYAGLIDAAIILKNKKYYNLALKCYKIVTKKANLINSRERQATAYNGIAQIYFYKDELEKSKKYFYKSDLLSSKFNNQKKDAINIF